MNDFVITEEEVSKVLTLEPLPNVTKFFDKDGEVMFEIDGDRKEFRVYSTVVDAPDKITEAFSAWVKIYLLGSS